jgi:hypothetical protein
MLTIPLRHCPNRAELPPKHSAFPLQTRTSLPHPTSFKGAIRMPNAALSQKLKPSKELADVLGRSEPVTRADGVKGLWDYAKKHNLQNPKNRREILADDKLRPLFGKDKISMFEVGKIVNDNLEKAEGGNKPTKKRAA